LILDDAAAHKFAEKLKLQITGTIRVLIHAKKSGVIPQVRPYLDKIQPHNFRISLSLINRVLRVSGQESAEDKRVHFSTRHI
jgi:predicted nucleic acid-binding protein